MPRRIPRTHLVHPYKFYSACGLNLQDFSLNLVDAPNWMLVNCKICRDSKWWKSAVLDHPGPWTPALPHTV